MKTDVHLVRFVQRILCVIVLAAVANAAPSPSFEAGEGVVDISPPIGTALGGWRYSETSPRLSKGVSTPPEARALALRLGQTTAIVVSLDMLNISFAMTRRLQSAAGEMLHIPPADIHICATHSHSMPSISFSLLWGDNNPAYEATLKKLILQAIEKAVSDLLPATLRVGSATVIGASQNRTLGGQKFKTDIEFTKDSTDAERWLDTKLHLLAIERKDRPTLIWYNFASHCTANTMRPFAGADWPGQVQKLLRAERGLSPSFLQGHAGDVAPFDEDPTARAVADGIGKAIDNATPVAVTTLRTKSVPFGLPLDIPAFKSQIASRKHVVEGATFDFWATFDQRWYDAFASRYDFKKTTLPITLSAIRLGPVMLLFHPSELYSYYGLAIQRGSPLKDTFVVGYSDGYVGYLADPNAYKRQEYAAAMTPKINNLPPFTPNAAREMTDAAVKLLRSLVK